MSEWWRGASIYQIYPRSFADADGDGVGDLPGITARLDHVASLGVDAIWISPFYTSPMADFGYDVADYRGVDPLFGTLADFDALVARAHALGLRVITDQVWSHTSDRHAWFVDSRSARSGERADWYVWADPKADGTPPNNWQSVFGGPAWTWDARRQQYYLHSFLKEQPQLNVRHPAVQDALLAVGRFWLNRGVDGFRLDAINHAMGAADLADNPPLPSGANALRTRSFDFQRKVNSQDQPDMLPFLERIRALTDEYSDRFTVAEVGGLDSDAVRRAYIAPGRLDTAYGFDFLYADALTPALVRDALGRWPDAGEGWPSWAFENHDAPRAVSRWAAADARAAFHRAKMALLAGLRGNIFVYQGEELALTQVDVPFEQLRDPEAVANWPLTLSRDGVRTPMPWRRDAVGHGFTTGTPWLPFGTDHAAMAVDAQEEDAASPLAWTREVLALRRARAALRLGDLDFADAPAGLVAIERGYAGERLLVAVNLTPEPVAWIPPPHRPLLAAGVTSAGLDPYGALVAELEGTP